MFGKKLKQTTPPQIKIWNPWLFHRGVSWTCYMYIKRAALKHWKHAKKTSREINCNCELSTEIKSLSTKSLPKFFSKSLAILNAGTKKGFCHIFFLAEKSTETSQINQWNGLKFIPQLKLKMTFNTLHRCHEKGREKELWIISLY